MLDHRGRLLMAALGCAVAADVLGGCALHATLLAEPIVGYATMWEESTIAALPGVLPILLGYIGERSEAICQRNREEIIAMLVEPFSRRATMTTGDTRVALEKTQPQCVPVIFRPASATTADFVIALPRRGPITQVIGWRTHAACRAWLSVFDQSGWPTFQCVPAFLIRAPRA
jgi:hypothetical protein